MGMSSMFCESAGRRRPGCSPAGRALPARVKRLNWPTSSSAARRERLLRRERAVGLDLDGQAVEVGHLADARVLDRVVDLAHGREDGVDGDDPDGQRLGRARRQVAHAALDGEVHLQGHVVGVEGQERQLRVDDLDVGVLADVGGRDRAGAGLDQAELHRMRGVALEAQLLDVEDDLGEILLDARDAGEFVVHVAHLDRGDGGALQGREQDAPERVARASRRSRPAGGWPRTWRTRRRSSRPDATCGCSSSIMGCWPTSSSTRRRAAR